MNNSLMKILNDPSLLFEEERMKKKIEEVKKDKGSMVNAAKDYNSKYKEEIEEGTKKRQLMIEDAKRRGLREEDVMKGSFVPCRSTPILNWLFFMMREENVDLGLEESRKRYNEQYGHLEDDYDYNQSGNMEPPSDMEDFVYGNCTSDMFRKIKKLKTLSRDCSNENEQFIAYRMAIELCNRYGLEFDKIPVYKK